MDDPSEPPDYDADRRRTERFVIGMAIGIPILLAVWDRVSFSRDVLPFFGGGGVLLSQVKYYITRSILQALAIWLAWRQPILGGKILRSSAIACLILFATISAEFIEYGLPGSDYFAIMLLSRLTMFLMTVAAMVLARRVYGITLVRDNDSEEYKSRRFSILELMLWTAVVAGVSAFMSFADQWNRASANSNSFPQWFTTLAFFTYSVLPALIIVAIAICWKFKNWRAWIWIPSVIVAFAMLSVSLEFLQSIVLKAYTNFPGTFYPLFEITMQMWTAAKSVFASLLVVYLMTKCGLRFRRSTRGSAEQ